MSVTWMLAVDSSWFSRENSSQWFVLVVGILATLYLIMKPKLRKGKDPLAAPPPLSVSQQRQIERDISNLMVEMLETARQMTAQLDTRATRLELLIQEADQKLAEMKQATAGRVEIPKVESVAHETVALPAEKEGTTAELPPDPRHGEVYALADEGRAAHEIARRLNRPNGEIELILALRPH